MPPGVEQSALLDLILSTLDDLDSEVTQTQRYTEYPLVELFFTDPVKRSVGGTGYQKRIRVKKKGTFRMTGFYETVSVRHEDVMAVVSTPYRFAEEHAVWDRKEGLMNSDAEAIVDYIGEKYNAMWESMMEGTELQVVGVPQSSADVLNMQGIFYSLPTKIVGASDPIGGFTGDRTTLGDGSVTTTINNQDRSNLNNERLRTWQATHDGVMSMRLVRQVRRALTRTGFRSVHGVKGPMAKAQHVVLMDDSFADEYEDMCANRHSDSPSGDVAGKDGTYKIRGCPIKRVPVYNDIAFQPVTGVRTDALRGLILKNEWLRRSKVAQKELSDVFYQRLTSMGNLTNVDPRGCGFQIHAVRTA